MRTLQDDLKLDGNPPLDMTLFWQTAAQLPARKNATRSPHAILRCRYQANGHRARTFDQMSHELGVTRTRAAELVRRALQRMRAYKAQFVIGLPHDPTALDVALTAVTLGCANAQPTAAVAVYPDAAHAQQWRRACDALGLGYAIHPGELAQAVRNEQS